MENDDDGSQAIIDAQVEAIIEGLPDDPMTAMAIAATVYKTVLVGFSMQTGARPETMAAEMHTKMVANIRQTMARGRLS